MTILRADPRAWQATVSEWAARLHPYAWAATVVLWAAAVILWLDRFQGAIQFPFRGWLTDWHVYAAGARDLLDGTLYTVPLVSPYPIPVDAFNLPPASALTAIPFLVLPDEVAERFAAVMDQAIPIIERTLKKP